MSAIRQTKSPEELYPVQQQGVPMAETQLHINQIVYLISALETFFQNQQALVLGDMTLYYDKENRRKFVVPDVLVVKSISKEPPRRVYKLWEEAVPDVIFEISSRETWGADLNKKWELYQKIGVREYYIFDPEYDYLPEPLVAYHLSDKGEYQQIRVKKNRIFSPALNLELVDTKGGLRLFNPEKAQFLPTMSEAFAEIERLKAELEKLKSLNQ
jgi:Uma2 family endonuclease